jgi:hypothetical protein
MMPSIDSSVHTNSFSFLYSMRVGLYYDQTFKARFGSDSIPAMRRVLAQVKFCLIIIKKQ